ncbi:MAG: glycosyltransferase family 2 protein, partial [Sneathiella sp.]
LTNQLLQTLGVDRLSHPKFFGRYQMRHWDRDTEREVEVISGCYLIVRQEVLNTVGYLDENFFFFGEETDWCRRIHRAGWLLKFSPVGEIIHHGSVSAWKLNERRDLLLGEAKVKLHLKYGGMAPAILVFFLLFSFNFSRAVFWSLRSLIDSKSKKRALHFRSVTRKNFSYWPGKLT